jgi:hypothetical protein
MLPWNSNRSPGIEESEMVGKEFIFRGKGVRLLLQEILNTLSISLIRKMAAKLLF